MRTYTARLADSPRRLTPTKMGNARYSFLFDDPRFPTRVRTRANTSGILSQEWSMRQAGDLVTFTLTTDGTIMSAELVERATP